MFAAHPFSFLGEKVDPTMLARVGRFEGDARTVARSIEGFLSSG